jgi:hypothetical protein
VTSSDICKIIRAFPGILRLDIEENFKPVVKVCVCVCVCARVCAYTYMYIYIYIYYTYI